MRDVVLTAGEEVVHHDNLRTPGDQGIGEVRPDKTGSSGEEDAVTLAVTLRNDHEQQPSEGAPGPGIGGAPGPGALFLSGLPRP
ncbi:hypothetical protein GCM10007977_010140 [Dactylosporangium sucinum]|uniref:Uncharacterized protein n=1 Tax=Dactylosporangium sucinum TaxID=1424081 RepID=A0A917WJP5_9ACTN|nr:hypothetical protein GCM10007977_010140 [Dactylosporangium sucinum]